MRVLNRTASSIVSSDGRIVRCKVLDIGNWNMDTTDSINVSHGLDVTKIISVSVVVRNDPGTFRYELTGNQTNINLYIQVSSTQVVVNRLLGGKFDSASFSGTGFSRGEVVILYVG